MGAPFPDYFQEIIVLGDTPLVGVVVTRIPLDRDYYVVYTAEWRSSNDYGPLQEASLKAIHAV